MKRSGKAGAALVVLVGLLAVAGVGDAQVAAPGVYDQTALEQEALELVRTNQLVTARTKAEEILRDRPFSIIGHYVLGRVLFEAEGSHARALFHLGRAREIYESTWNPESRSAGAPHELHREMLYDIARLAGQMELYDYQLQVYGFHDYLYDPDLIGERAWPLMKLGRFEEAREFATRALQSRNQVQRSAGLNALCAVEGEARTRRPYFEACRNALEDARREVAGRTPGSEDEGGGITVDAYNAAMGALAALQFQDAETFAQEGVHRFEITPASPWRLMLYMYIAQGRSENALEAVRRMQDWRKRQPAYMRDQARAETDAAFATLLMLAGENEIALRAVTRSLDQPDRRGLTTSTAEEARGHHALLRRIIYRTLAEQRREEASWGGFGSGLAGAYESISNRLSAWPDDERVAGVMTDEDTLVSSLRPYVQGGITSKTPWLAGELVDVLGAGVVAVALRRAREAEGEATEAHPYFDAIQAEVELARGDEEQALGLAQRALEQLPSQEVLLRARVAAIGSEAARETDRPQLQMSMLEQVLQLDAGTIRRMGLSLPCEVVAEAGGDAQEAADLIESSPRLRSASGGFRVTVTAVGPILRACLFSQHGNQIMCADAVQPDPPPAPQEGQPPPAPLTEEQQEELALPLPQRLAREFHRQIFSARIALSAYDMQSLDGRTITGTEVMRDQMQDLIEGENGGTP